MPRIARIKVKGEPTVYHIMSRTALDGFVLADVEKDFLLDLIKRLSQLYFGETIVFCLMGNHFHLLIRMSLGKDYTDEEIQERYRNFFGSDAKDKAPDLTDGQIPHFRSRWEDLSEFIKDIKQGFSRFYSKRHNRRGLFWAERFKSVIVDNGDTLINCLAYIDLNPVRAEMVEKPVQYRWFSIGYHIQRDNGDGFLSLDFGLAEFGEGNVAVSDGTNAAERLSHYRRFLYEKGGLTRGQKTEDGEQRGAIDEKAVEEERERDFKLNEFDRFRYRTRHFIDSGVIGSKDFVDRIYQQFKHCFLTKNEKQPKTMKGLASGS